MFEKTTAGVDKNKIFGFKDRKRKKQNYCFQPLLAASYLTDMGINFSKSLQSIRKLRAHFM